MEKICEIKEILIDTIYEVITGDLSKVNACELGEIVDVLKDIEQYLYYHEVIEAMENKEDTISEEVRNRMYYHNPEVETVEEVAEIIANMVSNMNMAEKSIVKQDLVAEINKL